MTRDPFGMLAWSRLAQSAWSLAIESGTTMIASASVVGHRGRVMDEALGDPAGADLPELTRMVVEKQRAFAEAGLSLWRDGLKMQADAAGAMLGRGASPLASAQAATSAASRALRPIRRTATANARRLGRAKR